MRWLSFLGVLLLPALLTPSARKNRLIVWNVGQGQWVTWVKNHECIHFDMGGERVDWKPLLQVCASKDNSVYFTHGDSDHISFFKSARKRLPRLCIQVPPPNKWARTCEKKLHHQVQMIIPRNRQKLKANDQSIVYMIQHRVLIPGDATQKMERKWPPHRLKSIHTLVLGHHGSQTSTGPQLLSQLPQLKLTISSSRLKKYGHPHPKVQHRLWSQKTPLLTTETWGSIKLDFNY